MVLPLPLGRSRRGAAVALRAAERRWRSRCRREEHLLLGLSRELFQRAHAAAQTANRELATSMFEQCIAALPTKQRYATRLVVRIIRAMALTQLGQLAEVRVRASALVVHVRAHQTVNTVWLI